MRLRRRSRWPGAWVPSSGSRRASSFPWKADGIYPFRLVVKELLQRSKAAKDAGDLGGAELFKQLGQQYLRQDRPGIEGQALLRSAHRVDDRGRAIEAHQPVRCGVGHRLRSCRARRAAVAAARRGQLVAATTDSIVHDAAVPGCVGTDLHYLCRCARGRVRQPGVPGAEARGAAPLVVADSRPGRRGGEVEGRWHAGPVEGRQGWGSLSPRGKDVVDGEAVVQGWADRAYFLDLFLDRTPTATWTMERFIEFPEQHRKAFGSGARPVPAAGEHGVGWQADAGGGVRAAVHAGGRTGRW